MTDKEIKERIYNKAPIDRIIEITRFSDYVEVIGEAGGDILIYRIRNNGIITER